MFVGNGHKWRIVTTDRDTNEEQKIGRDEKRSKNEHRQRRVSTVHKLHFSTSGR